MSHQLGERRERFLGLGKGGPLWRHKGMHLPDYIKRVAKHLIEKGMPESEAIASAVNVIKRWASGGKDVHPDTRAKAAAALAEWESLKARAGRRDMSDKDLITRGQHESWWIERDRSNWELPENERAQVADPAPARRTASKKKKQPDPYAKIQAKFNAKVKQHQGQGKKGAFDESKHPRVAKGSTGGGRFAKGGSGGKQAQKQAAPQVKQAAKAQTAQQRDLALKESIGRGERSQRVKFVQRRLAALGLLKNASGVFDASTEAAVKTFQTRNKLKPTGVIDGKTLVALKRNYRLKKGIPLDRTPRRAAFRRRSWEA